MNSYGDFKTFYNKDERKMIVKIKESKKAEIENLQNSL
jgi:hypothetical protein